MNELVTITEFQKLRVKFNKETGMYAVKHKKEYTHWLEQELVNNINYTRCSLQLKSIDVISFEEWKKRFVVKTETNNIYEFRGDFVLGEDLEFAYNKDVELYNSLIV